MAWFRGEGYWLCFLGMGRTRQVLWACAMAHLRAHCVGQLGDTVCGGLHLCFQLLPHLHLQQLLLRRHPQLSVNDELGLHKCAEPSLPGTPLGRCDIWTGVTDCSQR